MRYELEGELPALVNCHCQFCRRAHGAAFATVTWVPLACFRITAGEQALRRYGRAGGQRCFCGECGTRLYNAIADVPFVSLIVSTLDEPPEAGPIMHINVESKAPWYAILDGLPQHQALPPEVEQMLERLGVS